MSDQDRELNPGEAGVATPPSVGSQLKAAREAKEKSVGDIAMALKLGTRQVDALESGDWDRLPGHTFIRGFVRNYARLLQIDAAPLMAQLDLVLETPQQRLALASMPHATMPHSGRSHRRDYAMALFGLLLVVVAVGIYFLLPEDLSSLRAGFQSLTSAISGKGQAPTAPAAPEPRTPEPVFPPGTTPQQVLTPQAVTPPPPAPGLVPPPVLQAPAGAATPPAAGQQGSAPLRFNLAQESWIEVRDGSGKIVFSQRAAAGSAPSVGGQPPFSLVIGNAPGVRLQLRGQPVDLAPHTQGNVARLTLE